MSPPEASKPAGVPFKLWRDGFWRGFLANFSDPSRKRRFMVATVSLVAAIGIADYFTGFELSLLVFYLLPVCMAVAAVGSRFGIVTAFLSVTIWLLGDVAAGERFANTFVPLWNGLIALSTYVIVIWLLSSLIALHREMEGRVRQRTAALSKEISERVRLEKAVLEITERERRAIGHELHDGLSQHLTGTALVAQSLGVKVAMNSAENISEVKRIVDLIEQGIEQTRNLAKGLLLAEIQRDGLATALRELAEKIRSQFHVDCEFSCNNSFSLDENGTATHLFRIAEEAIRNAIRHGHAKSISVKLAIEEGNLVLVVRDNGSGLPAPSARGDGLGLGIMAHRSAIIGASLSIDAPESGGTCIACSLPLSASIL
jgi:signal transduction histidine kinase